MAEENDQETTGTSNSGDASPREPYRNLLAELHEAGTLGEDGYRHRLDDVDKAVTWGDLETAIAGLSRDQIPVPTRRRQRRELEDKPVVAETIDDEPLDEAPVEALAEDDEDDDFDLELPVIPKADGDVDDDDEDLDDEDDDDLDDDDDEDLDDDEDDDDLDDDEDLDDDLEDDEKDVSPAGRKSRTAKTSTRSGKDTSRGGTKRSEKSSREKKSRATPKRPSTTSLEPERTGPVQFVKESVGELRKVVYPTSTQLGTYFVVVLVFVLFVIGFTSGIDLGLGKLVLLVFG